MRAYLTSICFLVSITSVAHSQQVRMESVVTPDGVFAVQTSGPVSPGLINPPMSNPNPTAPGLRWVYPNGALPWITSSVGIGNYGTMDWLGQTLNGEELTFISPTETSPPTPIYADPDLTGSSVSIQVAAADKAPVCAVVWNNSTSGVKEIRLYSGFNTTPLKLITANVQEIRISDDGTRVAVGYTDANSDAAVDVYDGTLTYLTTLVGAGSTFRHHDISGDGSTVLIASGTTNFVYDVATGNLLHQDGSTVSHDAHAIDLDGDTWVRGGFNVGAWKNNGGTYSRIVNFSDSAFGFGVYDACDVSADGLTFVCTGRDATTSAHFKVYCWSLTATSSSLLWSFNSAGTGSYQDVGQGVSISDDGKLIAVGSWGDEFNAHPEVMVFDRNTGAVLNTIDTPGSCYSVDMSGDGQFVVAGTKSVHANTFGNGGEGYSLDNGGQGFWLSGTPSINRLNNLNFNGAVGDMVWFAAGVGLLPAGIPIGGFTGLWWLDNTMLAVPPSPLAPVPGSGTLTVPVLVPNNPGIVGLTVYAQAARTGGVKEIDNYLRLVVTP